MLTPQRLQEIKTLYTEWFNDLGKDTVKVATCVPELYREVESLQSSNAKLAEEVELLKLEKDLLEKENYLLKSKMVQVPINVAYSPYLQSRDNSKGEEDLKSLPPKQ